MLSCLLLVKPYDNLSLSGHNDTNTFEVEYFLLVSQLDSFEREVMAYVKPNHGTTTLGFIFKEGVIIAVDSRATQGSYIGMTICRRTFSKNIMTIW
jgi:20S proteasome alpha/beta subunit